MATTAELERALIAADAAGNTEDARALAQAIAAQRKPKAQPTQERAPRATDNMSGLDRFRAGIGKSLVDTGTGLVQVALRNVTPSVPEFITQGGDAVERAIDSPLYSRARKAVFGAYNAPRQAMERRVAERREIDKDLMSTGSGLAGNITGTLAQLVTPGAAARGTAAAPLLLPTTVRGNVAQGLVFGSAQPATSAGDVAENTAIGGGGGLLGAVIPKVAGAAWNAGKGLLAPFTQRGAEEAAARVVRGFAEDPARLLVRQPSAVPGVQRTLAEESLDPGIAQLQRTVAAKSGADFDSLARRNNAARVNAIRQFAKEESDVSAAKAARDSIARPLLRDAMAIEGVNTNRLIGRLGSLSKAQEGRPAVQKAINDVRGLLQREIPDTERLKAAAEPLKKFIAKDKASATNREAASDALRMIRSGERPAASFTSPPGTATAASQKAGREALAESRKAFDKTVTGQDKVSVLYNARKTINDMLSGKYGGDSAQALAGSRELMTVRNGLDRVLRTQSPEFGRYMDAYGNASAPINRMQIGQELLERASAGQKDAYTGLETLMPTQFGRQMRDLDMLAARATGLRKASAENILQPEDIATLNAVNDDLGRTVFASNAARGSGSDTFQKLMTNGDIIGAAQELGVSIPGSGIISMLGRNGRERVNRQLVAILTDPATAQDVLRKASVSDRRVIQGVLQAVGGAGGTALAVGSSN